MTTAIGSPSTRTVPSEGAFAGAGAGAFAGAGAGVVFAGAEEGSGVRSQDAATRSAAKKATVDENLKVHLMDRGPGERAITRAGPSGR